MSRNLSTAEVARILGIKEARVRSLARAGLCRPVRRGRAYAFSFQDLVVLRAARGLLDARVPPARVRRALAALARELPPGRPASGLRIYADGRQVAVRDGRAAWHPETGQTVLTFEVDELARRVDELRPEPAPRSEAPDAAAQARREFERALELEDDDREAACAAYERALALDPNFANAHFNLAGLCEQLGRKSDAIRHYNEYDKLTPD